MPPFTATVHGTAWVTAGRLYGSYPRASKLWGPEESPSNPSWRRYWLLASVQQQFWGLPWWDGKLVILLMSARGGVVPSPRDEIDFVDGRRLPGSITRFLPVYETFCTRTGPLADSEIDLRVLRDGPPHDGIRIMSRTVRLTEEYPRYRWEAAPSMKVAIRGPLGVTTVVSDAHGIYDLNGLAPGDYEIAREPVAGAVPIFRDVECSQGKFMIAT